MNVRRPALDEMKPQEHQMYSHEECFLVFDEDGVEPGKADDAAVDGIEAGDEERVDLGAVEVS
jgi:hypothetical protein